MSDSAQARLFVALMLGDELGRRLSERVAPEFAENESGFRFPRPESLHATLFFLGNVERRRARELEQALATAAAEASRWRAPALRLGRGGAFPAPGREKVLWVTVSGDGLDALWEGTLGVMRSLGIDVEREEKRGFHAHVTVARPRRGADVPSRFYAFDAALEWTPTEIAVVESVAIERAGRTQAPVYAVLKRIALASG